METLSILLLIIVALLVALAFQRYQQKRVIQAAKGATYSAMVGILVEGLAEENMAGAVHEAGQSLGALHAGGSGNINHRLLMAAVALRRIRDEGLLDGMEEAYRAATIAGFKPSPETELTVLEILKSDYDLDWLTERLGRMSPGELTATQIICERGLLNAYLERLVAAK